VLKKGKSKKKKCTMQKKARAIKRKRKARTAELRPHKAIRPTAHTQSQEL
jgi:hypothetical protein